ncbi:MAG: hypothetical protein E7Z89_00025 [Cyanobacteria bacterium SIG28]|nr:hypothetical protein [Cyanobacteria bacterium SIG28]
MLKKILLILVLFTIIPVMAEYDPLSEEPINSVEEFYRQNSENPENPEFEYPTDNQPEIVEIRPTKNYSKIYADLAPASHSYMHDIDPDQYYDMKDATWAPYPLLRLNSYIYFKDRAIEPGYYLLTPREHKGKWYLLFKQNGRVNHIIPIYERDIVAEGFYEKHLPKPKLTKAQKIHMGALSFLGKFKSTKRKEQVKSYMEISDLENHFVSIIIYYGNHKYSTIFRTVKL